MAWKMAQLTAFSQKRLQNDDGRQLETLVVLQYVFVVSEAARSDGASRPTQDVEPLILSFGQNSTQNHQSLGIMYLRAKYIC